MHPILDHLTLGSIEDARSRPAGIDAMLCVAEEHDLPPGVSGHRVAIRDMQPIPPAQLREAVEWLARALPAQRVLVFCNAGIGRSSSVAVGYLCCVRGMGFGEAVERVARLHPGMSVLPELISTVDAVRAARTPGS